VGKGVLAKGMSPQRRAAPLEKLMKVFSPCVKEDLQKKGAVNTPPPVIVKGVTPPRGV